LAGLKDIRTKLHKAFFKKTYDKIDKPRDFISLKQASLIGIIFDASHEPNIETVQRYIKKLQQWQKKVHVLAYIDADKTDDIKLVYPNIDFISKKEVNWYLKPKSMSTSRFIKNKYDILLNLYTDECVPLQYVSAFSDAKFRVGAYKENNLFCNDFLINLKEDKSLPALIEQIDHYLNKKQNG